ncbi:testis-expressed protein 101-like [Eublepharis macularius]|uniref:Testis-expressed protein 101-like n=1 Tax=Eublepharis macularius TaxID=481883 RepID=A0AA97KD14_EUBMA|nr:testis-expressed protein 101-like [Eublepharis macularius]
MSKAGFSAFAFTLSTFTTMQTLLGLIVLSVLLTPGSSLHCATCTAIGNNCTGTIEKCKHGEDACVSVWMEITTQGITLDTIVKRCTIKSACADLKSGIESAIQQFADTKAVVKEVECSKAPSSSGSLLLALFGWLLLKMLS